MEGEKDDSAIKESINEYKKAYEKLKEAYDSIVCQLQEAEQIHEEINKCIGKTNDGPVAASVIDNPTVDPIDRVNQFMMQEFKKLREFNIEMHEKLKELETFCEINNESVSAENDAKFWNLAAEIAKMQESQYGIKY